MNLVLHLLVAISALPGAQTPEVKRNIPYANPAQARQVLDVYSPAGAKNLPVVFWIHGGGWQTGDKTSIQSKPQAFTEHGFVFVSTNYRLLPSVDMATIVRDIAKSIHWVHDHIAEYGGDPNRLLVMGHSAGAQLAALICTDNRYLKAEGLSLAIVKGCVPVDGDTYDVPAIIETAETRCRVHGLPLPKFGHREKFGNDPAKHRDFSAVTHVAKDKGIPPFFLLYVANHPDTSAQAQRLGNVLKRAGITVTLFGVRDTTHNKINADIGLATDSATKALFEFIDKALKAPMTKERKAAERDEEKRLSGLWRIDVFERDGDRLTAKEFDEMNRSSDIFSSRWALTAKKIDWVVGRDLALEYAQYELNTRTTPKTVDVSMSNSTFRGIYSIDDKTLKVCLSVRFEGRTPVPGKERRPTDFTTKEDSERLLIVFVKGEKGK